MPGPYLNEIILDESKMGVHLGSLVQLLAGAVLGWRLQQVSKQQLCPNQVDTVLRYDHLISSLWFFQVFLGCISCEFSTLINIDFLLVLLQPFGHDPTAEYHCRLQGYIYIIIIYIYVITYIYLHICYIYIYYKPDQTMRGWKEHCTLCILSSCKFTSERHKPPLLDFPNTYYDMIQLSRRWEALGRRRWGPGPRGQTKKKQVCVILHLDLAEIWIQNAPSVAWPPWQAGVGWRSSCRRRVCQAF